jgi:hypothetical protein
MNARSKRPRLTDEDRFTISVALLSIYRQAMENLDMTDSYAGTWLRQAGRCWHAYAAFNGYPISTCYGDRPR